MFFLGLLVGFFVGMFYSHCQYIKFLQGQLMETQETLNKEVKRHNELSMKIMEERNAEFSRKLEEQIGKIPEDWSDLFFNRKSNEKN